MAETATRQSEPVEKPELTKAQAFEEIKKFFERDEEPTAEIRALFDRATAREDDEVYFSPEAKEKRVKAFDAWVAKHSRPYNFPERTFRRENWY